MSGRIQVSDSFILMAALAGFLDEGGIVPLFFAAAALHELGHALAIHLCGGKVLCLRLTAFGGVLRYRMRAPMAACAVWIAAAGPLAGLIAAWCAAGLGYYSFAGANLLLSLLNLLPVRPLDGGEMVYALLGGSLAEVIVEGVVCAAVGVLAGVILYRGGGCSLLLLTGALVVNLRKNLQKCEEWYTI